MNTVGPVSWKTLLFTTHKLINSPGSLQNLDPQPSPTPLVLCSPPLGNMATWRKESFPFLRTGWGCWLSTLHVNPEQNVLALWWRFYLWLRSRSFALDPSDTLIHTQDQTEPVDQTRSSQESNMMFPVIQFDFEIYPWIIILLTNKVT